MDNLKLYKYCIDILLEIDNKSKNNYIKSETFDKLYEPDNFAWWVNYK